MSFRIPLLVALLFALAMPFDASGQTLENAPAPVLASSPQAETMLDNVFTVITSKSVPAGTFSVQNVSCPAGTVALGGGVDVENVITMIVTSSGPIFPGTAVRLLGQPNGAGPAPVGWRASAKNTAASTQTMRVGVICANITGVTTVIGSDTAPAGSFDVAFVSCPAGSVATGGGIDPYNILDMEVSSSAPRYAGTRLYTQADGPAGAPNGWQATSVNLGTTAREFKVAAICAPLEGVTSVISSATANAGTFGNERTVCPAGKIAIGGGADLEQVLNMRITSTAPTFSGSSARLYQQVDGNLFYAPHGWQSSTLNIDSVTRTIRNAVICAKQASHIYLPTINRP